MSIALLFSIAIIAFPNSVNSLTVAKFPAVISHIDVISHILGDVDLEDFPDCDQYLKPLKEKCVYYYIKAVNETKLRLDINTESFQKGLCCKSWQMKACIAEAAEGIPECGSEVTKRYLIISNDRVIKQEGLDKCSEYGENPPICDFAVKPAINLFSIILSLIMIFFFS
jgi:hypothetical protein